MEFKIPEAVELDHKRLQDQLEATVALGGEIGAAARSVTKILSPHFLLEEECALPPLGLLPRLAREEVTPDMAPVLTMTEQLKKALPQMLEEHKKVISALDALTDVAWREEMTEFLALVEGLKRHTQYEEDVLYPAAILVGEYLKLKLNH